jgi:hypothetical protein
MDWLASSLFFLYNLMFVHKQLALLAACFLLVSCLPYSSTLKMKVIYSYKGQLISTGLYSVISKNIELFNFYDVSKIFNNFDSCMILSH